MWHNREALWGLCALSLVLFTPVHGLPVEFRISEYRGQRVLLVDGEIDSGAANRFEIALQQAGPIGEVLLHSPGGLEIEGFAMGRSIRRRGLATRVRNGARCVSACADILLGGVVRRVESGGRYGIHLGTVLSQDDAVRRVWARIAANIDANGKISLNGVRAVIQDYEKISALLTSRWVDYVLEMGASPRLVKEASKVDASTMKILTRDELVDLNIVNVVNE